MLASELERLFAAAGHIDQAPFTRAVSDSNEVWLGRSVVLRIAPADRTWTHWHELDVLSRLPSSVPHATVLEQGTYQAWPWLLMRRMPGVVLGRGWAELSLSQRRGIVHQLGDAMRALHQVPIPADWQRPNLQPAALAALIEPLEVAAPYQQPPGRINALADAARQIPQLDPGLINAAEALVVERLPLFADDHPVLAHTDLHWENLLVDGDQLSAVLDFEQAQARARDVELDVLLRFSHWPHLPVADEYEQLLRPEDFRQVPEWLSESYPEVFVGPHLRERLEVYAVLHDLRQAIQWPGRPGVPQEPWKASNRLRAVVSQTSYLARGF